MSQITANLSPLIILCIMTITFVIHLNPLSLWMSDMVGMVITSVFCLAVALYTAVFWREVPRDERELLHTHIADRYAFISANIVLIIAVIVSVMTHESDTWLLVTLFVMNTIKILARHLLERNS